MFGTRRVWGFGLLSLALLLTGGLVRAAWADDAPTEKPAEVALQDQPDAKPVEHGTASKSGEHKSDHGGAHHDPLDLSEGNASANLLRPDDLKFDMAFFSVVVFVLLLIGLTKFAWGPICHLLEEREHTIASQIEEAKSSAEKATQRLQEYEAKLAAAAEETRELMTQARRDGEALREQIVNEAKTAAQRERDRAVADIAAARDIALRSIAERSVDTAISLAGRIVHRELRPQDHQVLVREVLDQLPNQN